MPLSGARSEADGVPVLAVAHDLAGDGWLAPQRAAQLADEPAAATVVEVDMLAGQRRAATVGATIAVGLERADAAAQEEALELLYVGHRGGHRRSGFRHGRRCSCPCNAAVCAPIAQGM